MQLEVLCPSREEEWILAELGKHTDIFLKDSSEEKAGRVLLQRGSEEGFLIWENGDYYIRYKGVPDLCRALLLLSACKDGLSGEIREECSFSEFGVMLDLSRNAVLKISTLEQMICYAACLGMNFVGLYMEDTFFVEDEPYFGFMRGRVTHEEVKKLDAYARRFGVELRPYIQTLAHLNQITRYEAYHGIIDTKDILLVGEEKTRELLTHVIRSVSECFSTDFLHLGMDEAELLGAGQYLTKHGLTPKSRLMTEHLNMVLEICRQYRRRPQIWSDMFVHMLDHGDTGFEVPDDLTLCHWDYYSTDKEHYASNLEKHKKLSRRVGFAGGAWKWTGFVPHNAYSILAGRASIDACIEQGISSYTITCWGDDGAEASCFSVLPTLYEDAGYAFRSKMDRRAFQKLTGYKLDDFMKIDLVNPYSENGEIHNNCSKYLLYNDPLIGTFDSVLQEDTVTRFQRAADAMHENAGYGRFAYLFRNMETLCCALAKKADLGVRIRESYKRRSKEELLTFSEEEIPQLRQSLDAFYETFERQWKTENKSYGFEVQTIRLGGLDRRLADTARILKDYAEGKISEIAELEEPYQPFGYLGGNRIETLNYNLWSDIVSPSVIG